MADNVKVSARTSTKMLPDLASVQCRRCVAWKRGDTIHSVNRVSHPTSSKPIMHSKNHAAQIQAHMPDPSVDWRESKNCCCARRLPTPKAEGPIWQSATASESFGRAKQRPPDERARSKAASALITWGTRQL
eukprot:1163732-Pleurochrysis_carterae.AAC.1